MDDETTSFYRPLVGDGRPLLLIVAGALLFSGAFALFLAATGDFLPQDIHYLGMSAVDLCGVADCRIVDFMVHDRAAFGGTLMGLGVLYVWLTVFPLGRGEAWAWWVWLISAALGFATFLSYIGYRYLDTWHGLGTLLLLPVFLRGMARTRRTLSAPLERRHLWPPAGPWDRRSPATLGRVALLFGAAATAVGGLTTFLGLWLARPSRHLYQAIAAAGALSLVAAIGVHGYVGYTNLGHLAPALGALLLLVVGLGLGWPRRPREDADR